MSILSQYNGKVKNHTFNMDKHYEARFPHNVLPNFEVVLVYCTCSFHRNYKTHLFIHNLSNKITSLASYITFCATGVSG